MIQRLISFYTSYPVLNLTEFSILERLPTGYVNIRSRRGNWGKQTALNDAVNRIEIKLKSIKTTTEDLAASTVKDFVNSVFSDGNEVPELKENFGKLNYILKAKTDST